MSRDEQADSLKFKTNGELREEIAYVVGGDPSRYGANSHCGLKKADVVRVATTLQPGDSDVDVGALVLTDLYRRVCQWAGGEHEPNAGQDWKVNRESLKRIHRAVGGEDPRAIGQPEGGGPA